MKLRKPKSISFEEGLGAHKIQGDDVITRCARITLFDSEMQWVIVGEFLIPDMDMVVCVLPEFLVGVQVQLVSYYRLVFV
uniref:Uncharacterized protein n=1 Tax=Tanacetum cinerariifolium TaxID=118510 RepID=A0A699TES7_TANCI|nr:hypothetical protein [Tanacetum cinerariifolium]